MVQILRFVESVDIVRELSDEQGLYLIEANAKGEKEGEMIEFNYMRKGRFPNNKAAHETCIHKTTFEGDMPVGGYLPTVYDPVSDEWKDTVN